MRRLASASVRRAVTTPKRRGLVLAEREHLLGRAAERGGGDVPDVLGAVPAGLEEEEPRGAAVVLLRHGAHLPRPHDVHEARLLEHLHVVPDRAFREPELRRELGRRGGAVAEQADDPRAEVVAERPQLLRLADDEDVVGLVVRRGKVDDAPLVVASPNRPQFRNIRDFPTIRQRAVTPGARHRCLAPGGESRRGTAYASARWSRSSSRCAGTGSSRLGTGCTRSPSATARSSPPPGTRP